MWRVYKHTGKDKDYEVYTEALMLAGTGEGRRVSCELLLPSQDRIESSTS